MGNKSSKKNGENSQNKIGSRDRAQEQPRVSLVMRMSRMSRISMDNAFKQYVIIKYREFNYETFGKMHSKSARNSAERWSRIP